MTMRCICRCCCRWEVLTRPATSRRARARRGEEGPRRLSAHRFGPPATCRNPLILRWIAGGFAAPLPLLGSSFVRQQPVLDPPPLETMTGRRGDGHRPHTASDVYASACDYTVVQLSMASEDGLKRRTGSTRGAARLAPVRRAPPRESECWSSIGRPTRVSTGLGIRRPVLRCDLHCDWDALCGGKRIQGLQLSERPRATRAAPSASNTCVMAVL